MSTLLNFGRDVQGYNAYAPMPSTNCYSATITNGAATTITIPSNYQVWVVSFSIQPGVNLWVDFTGATAVSPVGATLASSTSVLNPGQRQVLAASKVSIITDNSTADVGIELWAISYP